MNKLAFQILAKLLLYALMKEDIQVLHQLIRNNNTIDSMEDQNIQSMSEKIRKTLSENTLKEDTGSE